MKKTTLIICLLALGLVITSLVAASPATPTDDWPPRPPTATPSAPSPSAPPPITEGGFIELHIAPPQSGLWTQVQWQDAEGTWHDVDGWGGTLVDNQMVLWYVGPEHLGKGSFRWQILKEDEMILATSELFTLPEKARQTVVVNIDLTLD